MKWLLPPIAYLAAATVIVLWMDTPNPKKIWTIAFVAVGLVVAQEMALAYLKRKFTRRKTMKDWLPK